MTHDAVLLSLSERLDRLETENVRLRAELAEVQSRVVEVDSADGEADGDDIPSVMSRRSWLARGAVVAAGAAVGGIALTSGRAAAVGIPVYVDQINTISAETGVSGNIPAATPFDMFHAAFSANNGNPNYGTGVFGYGPTLGVCGHSANGTGVWGKVSGDESHAAIGVHGWVDNNLSPQSVGVQGDVSGVGQVGVKALGGQGWGAWIESEYAEMTLGRSTRTKPTLDVQQHYYGNVVAENGANKSTLWYCAQSGTPGTWRRLGGYGTSGALTVLASAVRVYDSRVGQLPLLGVKAVLTTGVDRTVDCTLNSSGVPADVTALLLNVTVVGPSGSGNVSVRANGAPAPTTSNINFTAAGQTIANSVTTAAGAGAVIALRLGGAASCNAIVDVVGYYR